jgi:LacI family transcriptional regulator
MQELNIESPMSIVSVAKAAGVSTATVSRVLNDIPGVRAETIQRVRAAVDALNYSPLRVRRERRRDGHFPIRRRGRTRSLAIITLGQTTREWIGLPIISSVVAGTRTAASEHGFKCLIDELVDPDGHCPIIERREIDGAVVLVSSALSAATADKALANLGRNVPVVWAMGLEVSAATVDHVTYDNLRIGYLAYDYLRKCKCQETAFITLAPGWPFMRFRGLSFMNTAYDFGRPATAYLLSEDPMVVDCYGKRVVTAKTPAQLVAQLAAAKNRPTGLFTANDLTAATLYPLFNHYGLKVDRDLTIVSCDNEELRLSAMHPRPASIDIGADQVGYRAVLRLLARMEHPNDPPLVINVAPRLVLPPASHLPNDPE